ncbi:MAG: lipopolysaccharide biosynthesis protein [Chloroflexota bacterium]
MESKSERLELVTIRGTFWTYASQYSGKILRFLTTVVLAWLLSKEDIGLAGFALVVINFLDVLSDLGVGMALIYHRDHPLTADTSFWISIGAGFSLFGLTWLIAPYAGAFFNDMRSVSLTRVLALTFPITAFGNVHSALLRKELEFGRKFIPDTVGSLAKGLFSILLAFMGFGAWSIVLGQVGSSIVSVFVYWMVLPWRPTFRLVREVARKLLSYSVGIISIDTLGVLLLNVDYLIVGRYLGAAALGVYTLAFRLPEVAIKQFCGTLSRVIFPVYAKLRDEPRKLNQAFLKTMRYVSIVTIPLGLGLALVAEPVVLTFFSKKWIEAVPVTRAISIYSLVISLAFNAGDILKAQGRLAVMTNLALLRAAILIPALWWAATVIGSLTAVGWMQTAIAVITSSINLIVACRLFNTPFVKMLDSFRPAAISGVVMSLVVWGVLMVLKEASPVFQLLASVGLGGVTYVGFLWVIQRELAIETSNLLRSAWRR